MKIALAQIHPLVGGVSLNEKKILSFIRKAHRQKAKLIVFPEMALTGYPPLDMLNQKTLLKKASLSVKNIHRQTPEGIAILLGSTGPGHPPGNSVFFLQKKCPLKVFSKKSLADYDVFDEKRYFTPGAKNENRTFLFQTHRLHILICEEAWQTPTPRAPLAHKQKPSFIISLNASPFDLTKEQSRLKIAQKWARQYQCPFLYLNAVGAEEELIFDGASFILSARGQKLFQCPAFKEDLSFFSVPPAGATGQVLSSGDKRRARTPSIQKIQQALIFGLREFAQKNGFKKAHLGLSGGVDSAVTARLACHALGEKNVRLLFLPGPFTSPLSEQCARALSRHLHLPLTVQSITPPYKDLLARFKTGLLKPTKLKDITRQNIQARLRNLYLMAYANNHPQSLLLGSANKSELALGYGTLYGDLAGGLLPVGDLFKTEIYALARALKLPRAIIQKPPSAELKKNQKDTDDLPPYQKLDPVLRKLIEEQKDPQTAFEKQIFHKMIQSEFKRRQAPPILKIKPRSFDKGWRWPLSLHHYSPRPRS